MGKGDCDDESIDWASACDHRPCCWVAISLWLFPSAPVGSMGISLEGESSTACLAKNSVHTPTNF